MIIDDKLLSDILKNAKTPEPGQTDAILKKAKLLKGITKEEALSLLLVSDEKQLEKIFDAAKFIKEEIYGNRLVLFAPLYISNICANECLYCAFRASNKTLKRRALTQAEIEREVMTLLKQGHKRILLVAGEAASGAHLKYIFDAVDTIYKTRWNGQSIRRVNVNIAPLTTEQFKELAKHNIGTYQLFQETYHPATYKKLHLSGPKTDYNFRLEAMDRAFEAGIADVGIGPLLGLYDYKYETLAVLSHIEHLEKKYGVGPHTISIPRIEPAEGSELSEHPPYQLTDTEFKKVIAVLRLAVPYTGIILSTRENAEMRRAAIDLGVSQISAGSRTNPGGYEEENTGAQFSLGDHRTMAEVIEDIAAHNHVPSFCTGCYRKGRVGKDFMDLAKPGLIKQHCLPNALFTFAEYLHDFADEKHAARGFALIKKTIDKQIADKKLKEQIKKNLAEIKAGKRDVYF